MLNIIIDEDTKLTSDKAGLNVMIEKRIYKEDDIGIMEPTDRWKVDGHFGSVPAAVRGLIKRGLNNSDAKSFDELIADMERIEKSVMDAMHQINM